MYSSCFSCLVFSLGDVRMKPIPTLPSPLQDAPSCLRSSFLISVRVLLVLLAPVCKNKVRFSHVTLSEALFRFVALLKGGHLE